MLVTGLAVSQVWHEAGHALAAAAEGIPLLSCGIKLYFLLFPTFYVELESPAAAASSSFLATRSCAATALTDLRIATAGVWHNVVLAAAVWVLAGGDGGGSDSSTDGVAERSWGGGLGVGTRAGEALGLWERMEEGVVVTAVNSGSALARHLPLGARITHLDDFELDISDAASSGSSRRRSGTVALWTRYLSSPSSVKAGDATVLGGYDNLGWCLDQGLFSESVQTGCCASKGSNITADASSGGLCFHADSPIRQACLDPLSLNLDAYSESAHQAARCVDTATCSTAGAGRGGTLCARVAEEEEVVRIRVALPDAAGAGDRDERRNRGGRTVWWQGPRVGVLHQVTVTDLVPGYGIVPLGLQRVLEQLYSAIWSTSVGLAFFNLLPLEHLDGAHILAALLDVLSASSSRDSAEGSDSPVLPLRNNERLVRSPSSNEEWLVGLLGWMARSKGGRTLPVTLSTLTALISDHHTKLSQLYTVLSPAPKALVEEHLSLLHSTLASTIHQQLAQAEQEVSAAEERLALGWKRVHDWQTALGEPLRPAKKRGDGPLVSLVEDVDRIKEGMKSRMQERGQRILGLQKKLRGLAEIVGREWLEISLEQGAAADEDDDRWEDLDLTQNRMNALEREVVRCESEIAHRKELLDSDANEIFALRCELGIHQETTNSLGESTSGDPFDEEILWHLGVGETRQEKREMLPTAENVQKLEAKRKWLEDEKDSRNETIQTTYDKLYPLWTMLGVTEEEMDDFVNRNMGSTMGVVNAYQAELARMLALKRTNMSAFIQRERETMTELWDRLYTSYPQRLVEFPAYSISVEPTKVWNAAHGCDELVVSDNVSEELLVAHERERERLEKEVEDAGPMLDRLARYFAVVDLKKQLEAAASDPSRLTDKSRGAAQRLAQEAKDRVRVDREKPKLEAELRRLIPQWEATHGRPFLVNGVSFIEGLDEQIRAEEQEKENRKRAKLGASVSAGAARPLRPQHTGAAASAAPLKRQMTGASARSATSAASTDPPAAKRFATGPAAPTPSAARIARPKSALGDANGAIPHYTGASSIPPPSSVKPLRAQVTGIARPRAGTVSVAQTPMTGSRTAPLNSSLMASAGPGMRLPPGWGAAAVDSPTMALGGGGGAGAANLGAFAGGGGIPRPGLLAGQTGSSFRPMGR
ncbi:hypothetical protein JCM10908_001819 [Rhodotorula pacifica]|uniref:Ase1p n=1 Tax=Rhodotorula pacifica TaxID=1495444 RepID=UPI0031793669